MLAVAHKVAGEQESPYVAAFDEIFVGREKSAPNFTASFHRMIIHAIDRLQNNYFLELTGPTSYTISPQPQRLS